jgi:WD40 repeat protein
LQPCESYEDVPVAWEGVHHGGARIIGVAITDDRSQAAVLDLDGKISVWATNRGELLKEFPVGDTGELNWGSKVPMLFSPDRRLLAVGGADGTVRVWNPLTGTRLFVLARRDTVPGVNDIGLKAMATTRTLAFNQSGSLLAATNGFGTAFWSMRDGQRLKGIEQRSGYSTELAFIGDSSLLIGADSGLLKIYPRIGSAPISTTKTPLPAFGQMVRSPDQRWLAMNVWGDSIVLWSLRDNVPGPTLAGPPYLGGAGAIAFSRDGNTVAISGGWAGLYVWDVRSGKPIRSFHKYPGAPRGAWFLADGKSIVTWSIFDDSLRVVRLSPESSRMPAVASRPAAWGSGQRGAVGTPGTPLGMISGVVRDSSRRAVGGAEVTIADGNSPDSTIIARQTTSPGGYFSFFGIKVPHVILRARKPGFETTTSYIHVAGGEIGTDLVMKREKTLPER